MLIFINILRPQTEIQRNKRELISKIVSWNMQHRHGHQTILSSISRVIPKVTSHRAGSPTSAFIQSLSVQHAQKPLQGLCPARPRDYLKTVQNFSTNFTMFSAWFITKYNVIHSVHWMRYSDMWNVAGVGSVPTLRRRAVITLTTRLLFFKHHKRLLPPDT